MSHKELRHTSVSNRRPLEGFLVRVTIRADLHLFFFFFLSVNTSLCSLQTDCHISSLK